MDIRDLPPRNDPRGGSPKTPFPPARRIDISEYGSNHTAVWRTIAIAQMTAMLALAGAVYTLGTNNVKWSDVDNLMATRAPYIHDRERIQENLNALRAADTEAAIQRSRLESRIQELEKNYYRDHAKPTGNE